MAGEDYRLTGTTAEDLLRWRFGADLEIERYGYGVGPGGSFVMRAGGRVVGTAGFVDASPPWLVLSACPGAERLPPGDGLGPSSTIRTRAEALAWLDAQVGIGEPKAENLDWPSLPAPGTGRREVKLVRRDQAVSVGSFPSSPMTFSVWAVNWEFLDGFGQPSVNRFEFPSRPEPGEVKRWGRAGGYEKPVDLDQLALSVQRVWADWAAVPDVAPA